jgi:tetratricopeptide (TPR) repeat protein
MAQVSAASESLAEVRFREALALHQQSRLEEAACVYRQVLERDPAHVHALNFLAAIAFQANEFEQALELSARVLGVDSMQLAALLIQGHALVRLDRLEAAVLCYARLVALKPDLVDAWLHHGNVLQQLGRPLEALASYERAIALQPHLPEPYLNLGLALHELKRFEAALESIDQALTLNPGRAEAYYAKGNVLKDLRQLGPALANYDRAIAVDGAHVGAYVNRGNVLSELERFDEALESYDRAIRLAPTHADAHCNRGAMLCDLGRSAEALASLDRAVTLAPDHPQAHFTRGFVCLLRGDLAQGWREFEWRWQNEHFAMSQERRQFAQPQWRGESLEGKRLLVHCEQGLGDTIQFCRYLSPAAERGAEVIFEVPPELDRLLRSVAGVAQWVRRGEPLPPFDFFCPLLSLPMAFNTTVDTVPARVPYLRASCRTREYWREKLGEHRRRRVGLVWSGGFRPGQPELGSLNARRNIPLIELAVLAHPDIDFYSLQKGQPAEAELAAVIANGWQGPSLIDHTRELVDFEATAGLIEQLDLVISVDTSSAHLAGALGKPIWLLNRFDTCWRWFEERIDSPWYPSLRLYRQERRGDWQQVMRQVRNDLERFASPS